MHGITKCKNRITIPRSVTLNIFFDLSICKIILNFTICFVEFCAGLICKWTSAQEPRLVLGYKSLIKTALSLGLVKLKLGWIGQEKLSLDNKKSAFAQWIVITVK
jgi:hypothetical protein